MENFLKLLQNASHGDEEAIQFLFKSFRENLLDADEQEQVHLYLKQASRSSHIAIYLRAMLYEAGYGVKVDFEMCFLLMREAAGKGNAKATYEVGRRFLEGIGVTQNPANALQWLQIAAGSPHYSAEAMYYLGHIYEHGIGVAINLLKANEWYNKAAARGYRKAH